MLWSWVKSGNDPLFKRIFYHCETRIAYLNSDLIRNAKWKNTTRRYRTEITMEKSDVRRFLRRSLNFGVYGTLRERVALFLLVISCIINASKDVLLSFGKNRGMLADRGRGRKLLPKPRTPPERKPKQTPSHPLNHFIISLSSHERTPRNIRVWCRAGYSLSSCPRMCLGHKGRNADGGKNTGTKREQNKDERKHFLKVSHRTWNY